MKGPDIQNNLYLVGLIIENIDIQTALIDFSYFRANHEFLEAVIVTAGFWLCFLTWIRHLYTAHPRCTGGVEWSKVGNLRISRSIQCFLVSPLLYVLALEPFLLKLKANPVLHGIILPQPGTLC